MPSAQHLEVDGETGRPSTELRSLLRELHASNNGYLNAVHRRGKVLFVEGEPALGVYIMRTGRAAVSISSSDGRMVILRTAQPGDVLGLNSALNNSPHETTVKTLEPCCTDFVPRAQLISLMEKSIPGGRLIVDILGRELTELIERTRLLLLPQNAGGRLARLLLQWSNTSARIDRFFTHEEIAHMICSSRETVTRLLASMTRRKIIEVTSETIIIRDFTALEKLSLGQTNLDSHG